ncbi:hypothetical protein C5167_032750 [Papaver somniferum]|uniref:Uncharacterized protein n=1 Tax=Papaver somniferum TaxID=3469 RepID=A0A4Y7KCE0_PAPSO|nr:hypothetical protein C5167_032750 [Papaver somniferum]
MLSCDMGRLCLCCSFEFKLKNSERLTLPHRVKPSPGLSCNVADWSSSRTAEVLHRCIEQTLNSEGLRSLQRLPQTLLELYEYRRIYRTSDRVGPQNLPHPPQNHQLSYSTITAAPNS